MLQLDEVLSRVRLDAQMLERTLAGGERLRDGKWPFAFRIMVALGGLIGVWSLVRLSASLGA